MRDAKLFTEVTHACLNGITTTSKVSLDSIYKRNDRDTDQDDYMNDLFEYAIDTLLNMQDLHRTALMKPYQFYSLALAIMHVYAPIESLENIFPTAGQSRQPDDAAIANLTALAEVLDTENYDSRYRTFVAASESKTNVAAQRRVRFQWMCRTYQSLHSDALRKILGSSEERRARSRLTRLRYGAADSIIVYARHGPHVRLYCHGSDELLGAVRRTAIISSALGARSRSHGRINSVFNNTATLDDVVVIALLLKSLGWEFLPRRRTSISGLSQHGMTLQ